MFFLRLTFISLALLCLTLYLYGQWIRAVDLSGELQGLALRQTACLEEVATFKDLTRLQGRLARKQTVINEVAAAVHWSEALEAVAADVPPGALVRCYEGGADGSVVLEGEAADLEAVARFFHELETGGRYADMTLSFPTPFELLPDKDLPIGFIITGRAIAHPTEGG